MLKYMSKINTLSLKCLCVVPLIMIGCVAQDEAGDNAGDNAGSNSTSGDNSSGGETAGESPARDCDNWDNGMCSGERDPMTCECLPMNCDLLDIGVCDGFTDPFTCECIEFNDM